MTSVTQLITQEIYNKASQRLKMLNKVSRAGIRLQAIISAKEHGVGITANIFGVSENTLRTWVKSFSKEDVGGLNYKPGRGRPGILLSKYSQIITKFTKDNCNITLNQIAQKLLDDYNVVTSKSAVHRALQKLGLSYITPRPVHHKQKAETQQEFKKNLASVIADNPNKDLYFFDEARFGTRSNVGYGWFERGLRTKVKISQGFENFYVYSAIEVSSGKDFSLCFPQTNTACMNKYLECLSESLGGREIILVLDCAGWHKSKDLLVPANISIIYLPPYSPELNPVEKFWQYIKSYLIKNRIYKNLAALEDAVSDFITNLDSEAMKITCSLNHALS